MRIWGEKLTTWDISETTTYKYSRLNTVTLVYIEIERYLIKKYTKYIGLNPIEKVEVKGQVCEDGIAATVTFPRAEDGIDHEVAALNRPVLEQWFVVTILFLLIITVNLVI